jgi:uncharacterized protein YlxW (UPF0749 family)
VTTLRTSDEPELLENARESDLVILLDSLTQQLTRLELEQADLVQRRQELLSGDDAEAAARTRELLDAIQILNGTVAVEGPGIEVRISDRNRELGYDALISVVQELRDAGAEAIELNGVRVHVASFFDTTPQGVMRLDRARLTAPYVFKAIGPSKTLATAMKIPGGVADTVASLGGSMRVSQEPTIVISSLAVRK